MRRVEASQGDVDAVLSSHFRCPPKVADFSTMGAPAAREGYFRFGADATCYGSCHFGTPAASAAECLQEAHRHVRVEAGKVWLPFDPTQVIDNLRFERYMPRSGSPRSKQATVRAVRRLYYSMRPFLPVPVRKHLQHLYLRGWQQILFPSWPVDRTVENILERLLILAMKARGIGRIPFIWFWPDGARSCTILTHDVETPAGVEFCPQLMDLDDSFGVKAAFQLVPEKRYPVPKAFLDGIRNRGFEINVHDLNHDGRLFNDREEFLRRADRIKRYAMEYGAQGFRSAVLYRNAEWCDALGFAYDMSIPNVGHLDPQRGGCCTVFPYFIGRTLELPVTTTQDYSLFHILEDYSTRLWKRQIDLIRASHGLISVIIHPDYVIRQRARRVYVDLLEYVSDLRAAGETYTALPGEVAAWWKLRGEMRLVGQGSSWRVVGKGSERARVAHAVLQDDRISYEVGAAAVEQGPALPPASRPYEVQAVESLVDAGNTL